MQAGKQKESFWEKCKQNAYDALMDTFPVQNYLDIRDTEDVTIFRGVPSKWNLSFLLTLAYQSLFVGFLIYFVTTTTITMQTEYFLAPSVKLPDGASCEIVTIAITGVYSGDYGGHWSSSKLYNTSKSIYEIDFDSTMITKDAFIEEMNKAVVFSHGFMEKAVNRDMVYSLMVLLSSRYYSENYNFEFYYNADASYVFGLVPFTFSVGSVNGFCNILELGAENGLETGFDSSTNNWFSSARKDIFETYCNETVFYDELVYAQRGASSAKINFDVRTLTLLYSLNFDIFRVAASGLSEVALPQIAIDFNQEQNNIFRMGKFYIDSFYKNMAPMFCLNRDEIANDGPDVCFYLLQNGMLFYPSFQLYNYDDEHSCNCTNGFNADCNSFDVVVSMYFHSKVLFNETKEELNMRTIAFGLKIQDMIVQNGDLYAYDKMHRISEGCSDISYYQYNKQIIDYYYSNLFELCDYNCSVLTMEVMDVDPIVNQYGIMLMELTTEIMVNGTMYERNFYPMSKLLQLTDIPWAAVESCTNEIYFPQALQSLALVPPTRFEEAYQICHLNPDTAFQRSLGIGAGSATLYSNIFLTIMLTLVVEYLNFSRKKKDQIRVPRVKEDVRTDAVKRLMLHLLYNTAHESEKSEIVGLLKSHNYDTATKPNNVAYTEFVLHQFVDAKEKTRDIVDDFFESSLNDTSNSKNKMEFMEISTGTEEA